MSRTVLNRINAPAVAPATIAILLIAVAVFVFRKDVFDGPHAAQPAQAATMLILRGIAGPQAPRGQLDDPAALEYARELGYAGEVLDVAGNTGADNAQVKMAVDRIRHDESVTALYGFSGGGYNARRVWNQLNAAERRRIGKIVVIGSPGVAADDFPGSADVIIKADPPAGHMAGPKTLLESVRQE